MFTKISIFHTKKTYHHLMGDIFRTVLKVCTCLKKSMKYQSDNKSHAVDCEQHVFIKVLIMLIIDRHYRAA